MLSAAVLHASWHALVKTGDNQLTVLAGMSLVAALCAAVVLPFVPLPPPSVWLVLFVSLFLHSGYRFSLAQAYAHGDLSQAYPLGRGFVPIFATAIGFLTLGQTPSPSQLVGTVIVSAGVSWIAGDAVRQLQGRLILAAAGVGITVAGYSVLDAYGARASGNWLSFTAWLIVLDSGSFVALMACVRGRQLWGELADMRQRVSVAGILGVISFAIFIWALSRSSVGAVAALRETSILFATLIGMTFYGEERVFRRIAAAVMIMLGIVLISISG
jgi:drug/metabolite transporter (DMT)-like permease